MNAPEHYVVQRTTHEFRIPTPATARDLCDAVFIVDSWIKANEPRRADYDDRFTVEVSDEYVALVVTGDAVTSEVAS